MVGGFGGRRHGYAPGNPLLRRSGGGQEFLHATGLIRPSAGNPLDMKPHARLKVLSAVVGGGAMLSMAVIGVAMGPAQWIGPAPATVVAPATGPMTVQESGMTTSTAASFRPTITASIPPPPD